MLPPMSETTQPAERVRAPGIMLAIYGGLGVLYQIFSIVSALIDMPFQRMIQEKMMSQGGQPPPPEVEEFLNSGLFGAMNAIGIVFALFFMATAAFTLWGGLQMLKLRHHGACMGAAIVAMLPCLGCCCVIGLPLGIWAVMVLNRADVRSAFGVSNSN
jgi:hypothetical protein